MYGRRAGITRGRLLRGRLLSIIEQDTLHKQGTIRYVKITITLESRIGSRHRLASVSPLTFIEIIRRR